MILYGRNNPPRIRGTKIEKTDHVFDKGGTGAIKTEQVNGTCWIPQSPIFINESFIKLNSKI